MLLRSEIEGAVYEAGSQDVGQAAPGVRSHSEGKKIDAGFMLDKLAIAASSICLLFGALLIFVGVSELDIDQILAVLGGAALLSLGLTIICLTLKNKSAWRQNYEKYRVGSHN
jgi:hypothetical protein